MKKTIANAALEIARELSLLAGALLQRFLFGLSPLDPVSYALITGVLLAAAIAATAVPVRRARAARRSRDRRARGLTLRRHG